MVLKRWIPVGNPETLSKSLHPLFGFQLTSKAVFARQLALTATRENYVAKSSEFLSFPVEILSTKSNVNWLTFIQQRGFSTTPSPIAQRAQMPDNTETPVVYNVEFEVFGLVQGVFFRKYTQRHAQELGLTGWVQNTPRDTVIGQLQGSKEAVEKMKEWLSRTGSPHSKIDKCEFRGEGPVSKKSFTTFDVRH
ncbi:acylphosphatase-2-like isoform X2 [Paramacrobiotus metropolitanus]|uniref:acylphosphatase-2-like isoform X2 n=1 Tax=Paramacrobiotus metropolitanus TaxID=2943436 RepID=UPI0024456534|nr:acylphosphatase-2-like isoform X2 [Paramacrobiotus metropolitanus]